MIQPQELRLGNILYHKSGKTVDVTVGVIEQFVCDKKFSNNVWYPIPLTEEWLIKLGFHEIFGFYAVYGREITLKLVDGYWDAYFKGKYVSMIKHVHQLQNLFYSITGQELLIKTRNRYNMKRYGEFKVGDIVEITSNIPFQLQKEPRPILGKITDIDGAYIYVRPKYKRYICEFYACELKLIK